MNVKDDMEDYDVQIDSEYYNNDYDDVDTQQEEENREETDILFE